MADATGTPLQLEPRQIEVTIATLGRRIEERFPEAGLAEVCAEL